MGSKHFRLNSKILTISVNCKFCRLSYGIRRRCSFERITFESNSNVMGQLNHGHSSSTCFGYLTSIRWSLAKNALFKKIINNYTSNVERHSIAICFSNICFSDNFIQGRVTIWSWKFYWSRDGWMDIVKWHTFKHFLWRICVFTSV